LHQQKTVNYQTKRNRFIDFCDIGAQYTCGICFCAYTWIMQSSNCQDILDSSKKGERYMRHELNKSELRLAQNFEAKDLPFCRALEESRKPKCSSCGQPAQGSKMIKKPGMAGYTALAGLCEGCETIAKRWDELTLGAYEEEGPGLDSGGIAEWLGDNDISADELIDILGVDEDYAERITGGQL
jgi:hypothetical protein